MTVAALIYEAEEGGYWAEVPGLPGCITEGDTLEEVQANLKEAVHGWLDTARDLASDRMASLPDRHPRIVELAV